MYLWISFDLYVFSGSLGGGSNYRSSGVVSIDVTGQKSSTCLVTLKTAAEFLGLTDHEFKFHKASQHPDSFEGKIWSSIKERRLSDGIASMRMTSWQIVKAFD